MEEFQFNQTHINYIQNTFSSGFKFRLAMFKMLPMGYLSKMRITELSEEKCSVSVPYRWLNKNPFKSTFWAVQGMAAEMSSGALLTMFTFKQKPSVAMLVLSMDANFVKKANTITTFTCNDGAKVKQAILETCRTGEPKLIECKMTGLDKAGEEISHFTFTWSVKARIKKS